jgi:hypothetical protein
MPQYKGLKFWFWVLLSYFNTKKMTTGQVMIVKTVKIDSIMSFSVAVIKVIGTGSENCSNK